MWIAKGNFQEPVPSFQGSNFLDDLKTKEKQRKSRKWYANRTANL